MKKSMMLSIFLTSFSYSYSQKIDTSYPSTLSREQLLKESKTKKTIGWLLVGTGMPVVVGSIYCLAAFDENDINKGSVRAVLGFSTLYTLAGVLHIRAGNKNKERAHSISLNINHFPLPSIGRLNHRLQPALSLCLSLP